MCYVGDSVLFLFYVVARFPNTIFREPFFSLVCGRGWLRGNLGVCHLGKGRTKCKDAATVGRRDVQMSSQQHESEDCRESVRCNTYVT